MKTGNVKQVAAFEKLIGFCSAHGATYNPSKASLKLTALNALLQQAQQSVQAVNVAQTHLDTAINQRGYAMQGVPKLVTKIINALSATDALQQTLDDARIIQRRLRSRTSDRQPATGTEAGLTQVSSRGVVSYLDFDNRVNNLARLVQLISTEPLYKPNEIELQLPALNALVASLREKNKAVMSSTVARSNARIMRNRTLFGKGIHDVALGVKRYVKSVFGTTSEQYLQVRGLKFSKI